LSILESIVESILEYSLQYVLKFVMLEKYIKKVMVSQNLRHTHLLEVGLTKIPGDHETLPIVRHKRLHIDFSSMKSSLSL
jgi:hypothetical protein